MTLSLPEDAWYRVQTARGLYNEANAPFELNTFHLTSLVSVYSGNLKDFDKQKQRLDAADKLCYIPKEILNL
jgi:hypothetical protein